jgi:hypothetical protein
MLCHATANIEEGLPGRWRLRLHVVGDVAVPFRVIEQDEAESFVTDLKSVVRDIQKFTRELR